MSNAALKVEFTPEPRDAQIGLLRIVFPDGVVINRARLMISPAGGRRTLAMPLIRPTDPRAACVPAIEFSRRSIRRKYEDLIFAELRRAHPELFVGGDHP